MLFTEDGFGVHTYYNNLLIRNSPYAEGSAIRIKGVNQTGIVYGNTYYGYGPILNSSPIATIRNNIFYGLGQTITSIAFVRSLAGSTISDNIYYDPNNQFPAPTGGTEVNPLFFDINFASINLRLQRTSPAIGIGANLGASYNTDIQGVSRDSNWDIGAYEYIPLTVTVNQAVGQSDPTNVSPINYTVTFSESVSDFITGDVTISGTSGATTATVTGTGTTYNVAVSGMTGSGTIILSILADKATGATSNTNALSTSTDNTVVYDVIPPSGGSISYVGQYYVTTLVGLTFDDGTDSGSGIDTSTRTVQRASALLNNGVCETYSLFATITPTGTYPNVTDLTVVSGNCYIYRYLVSDNVGNQIIYTSANEAKIDTTPPATPGIPSSTTPTTSSTQTWTWTAAADPISGVANYLWRTTGTAIANGTSATNSVDTSLAEGTYSFFVKAVDGAGNQGAESEAGTLIVAVASSSNQNVDTNNSGSPSNSQKSASSCNDPVLLAPELFQADVRGNSVKLFFTPLLDTDKFYFSYSTNSNAEEHGSEVTLAREGVQNYTINLLKPNAVYYFKIRGQKGCMSGNWSNIIQVKTGPAKAAMTLSYYMNSILTKATSSFSSLRPAKASQPSSAKKAVKATTPVVEQTSSPTATNKPEITSPPATTYQAKPVMESPAKKQACFLWWCW